MTVETLPAKQTAPSSEIMWQVGADQLALKLTGIYTLDVSDPGDVSLFHELEPQGEYEVRAAVVVTGCGVSWKRDRNGDTLGVVAVKTLTVDSIYRGD